MRFRILTNRPLQFKFLTIIVISMLVPLVLLGGCLYYLIFTMTAERLGVPESIAYNLFPVISQINLILLVAMPPIAFLVLLWGIFLSHKFIGPLVRLEKELRKVADNGDGLKRLRVRKNDVVKPLVDSVNHLLDRLDKKR